jgi:hypothetical protein
MSLLRAIATKLLDATGTQDRNETVNALSINMTLFLMAFDRDADYENPTQ